MFTCRLKHFNNGGRTPYDNRHPYAAAERETSARPYGDAQAPAGAL